MKAEKMDWRELHDTKTKGELAKMVVDLQSQLEKEKRVHKKVMWLAAQDVAELESQLEERDKYNEIIRIINEDVLSLVQYSEPRVYDDLKKLISKTNT